MNKEEKRINNKCNFINNLLLDNGLYKGISALVEIEEHISNLYDEIDNLQHQLEEKDKVINEVIELINNHNKLENELGGTIKFNLVKLLEILERGKKC